MAKLKATEDGWLYVRLDILYPSVSMLVLVENRQQKRNKKNAMCITFIPGRSVTLITSADFRVLTATADNPNWAKIEAAIKARDEKALIKAISFKEQVTGFGEGIVGSGDISIVGTNVYYRGQQLNGLDIDRMIAYITGGFPKESLILFLESKFRNTFPESVQSLYGFLNNKQMPLTDRGTVLGWKGVSADYHSIMTGNEPLISGVRNEHGAISNRVGELVWMERKYVNADRTNTCAAGLHIGSMTYAKGWGAKTMIVEFSPEHVVVVPDAEASDKLRVYKYRVVGEVDDRTYLGNTYNGDYVRPNTEPEPERIEVQTPTYVKPEVVAKAEAIVVADKGKPAARTDFGQGQADGYADGKAHQKRKFYEVDRGAEFKQWSPEYVGGYLLGYRNGRNNV